MKDGEGGEKHAAVVKKVKTIQPPQTTLPVKKKNLFFRKFFFFLLFIIIFGVSFGVAGVYVYKNVYPIVDEWLTTHNFKTGESTRGQDKSPFIPQQTITPQGEVLTIPQVVTLASPSVVSIAVDSSRTQQGDQEEYNTIGTGFIVDASGIIVTNQHVVRDTRATYRVVTKDNKTYTAKTIIRDEVNDIALIVIDAQGLPALSTGNSSEVQVGETVIAIGTPLGEFPGSVTVGVISGLGRTVRTGGFWETQKEYEDVLQTDAAINPGNSGGPLLNLYGEVIGVNFATTGGADNISFALPITVVQQRLAEFKQYGRFRTPYLGVSYRMVTSQEAEFYGVEPGALVRAVADNSPAQSASLRVGDIITKVNDKSVSTSLASSLSRHKVGDEITLTVVRSSVSGESTTLSLKVKLADRPSTLE